MFVLYLIGIATWLIANCNGESLETKVANNVAELLVDPLIDQLTPARVKRLAQLLTEYEDNVKAESISKSINEFTPKVYTPNFLINLYPHVHTCLERSKSLEKHVVFFDNTEKAIGGAIVQNDLDDIIVSPVATYLSLSMAAWGFEEATKEQLHALLGQWFTDPIEAQARYSKHIDNFNSFPPSNFNLKFKIFYPDNCRPKAYLKSMENIFRSESQALNYKQSLGQAKQTLKEWFKTVPHGGSGSTDVIHRVIEDLNEDTNLVITTALYFNRKFQRGLRLDSPRWFPDHEQPDAMTEHQFYLADGFYNHGEIPEFHAKFLELPYEASVYGNMSMFIVASTKGGRFSELENAIEKITVDTLIQRSNNSRVRAVFPSLSFSTAREITQPLENLGVQNMFQGSGDSSRYFDCPPQHYTKIIQKNIVMMQTAGEDFLRNYVRTISKERAMMENVCSQHSNQDKILRLGEATQQTSNFM